MCVCVIKICLMSCFDFAPSSRLRISRVTDVSSASVKPSVFMLSSSARCAVSSSFSFWENYCECLFFGIIFSATLDRSSLRWCTHGGLQYALSKHVNVHQRARGTLRSAWLQIHQEVSKSSLCSILFSLEGEKNP